MNTDTRDPYLPFEDDKQIVVLLSGGMDSTLAFMLATEACARRGYKKPIGLFVDLKQPYRDKEYAVIKNLHKQYRSQVQMLSAGVITRRNGNVPSIDLQGKQQIVPGRNMTLATLGANYGDDLWICADMGTLHHGQMADKSYAFFESASRTLSLAFGRHIQVRSPVGHLTKAELVRAALDAGVAPHKILKTSTCYHPTLLRCGECLTCVQRWVALSLNGLKETYTVDPATSEYMNLYRARLLEAWNLQDFSHYAEKRVIEVFMALEQPLDYPLLMETPAPSHKVYRVTPKAEYKYLNRPKIPKILHTIWIGTHSAEALEMQDTCAATFRRHHDEAAWEHRHWSLDDLDISMSVCGLSAAEIRDTLSRIPPTFAADVLRSVVVYLYGGVYIDVDFTVHGAIDALIENERMVVALQQDDEQLDSLGFGVANGFIAAEAEHPIMGALVAAQFKALRDRQLDTYDDYMDAVGVTLFNAILESYIERHPVKILPREFVIPYGYWEPDRPRLFKNTILSHHWNGLGTSRAIHRMRMYANGGQP